jgi:hypothetical protein
MLLHQLPGPRRNPGHFFGRGGIGQQQHQGVLFGAPFGPVDPADGCGLPLALSGMNHCFCKEHQLPERKLRRHSGPASARALAASRRGF